MHGWCKRNFICDAHCLISSFTVCRLASVGILQRYTMTSAMQSLYWMKCLTKCLRFRTYTYFVTAHRVRQQAETNANNPKANPFLFSSHSCFLFCNNLFIIMHRSEDKMKWNDNAQCGMFEQSRLTAAHYALTVKHRKMMCISLTNSIFVMILYADDFYCG